MLFLEPGLKEAVEAKFPSGNQPQPDTDIGKLVAQALLTELTQQQKQLYFEMEKHKLETAKNQQQADWVAGRAADAWKASAAKNQGQYEYVQMEQLPAARRLRVDTTSRRQLKSFIYQSTLH